MMETQADLLAEFDKDRALLTAALAKMASDHSDLGLVVDDRHRRPPYPLGPPLTRCGCGAVTQYPGDHAPRRWVGWCIGSGDLLDDGSDPATYHPLFEATSD
jgi:hypothetical protein